MQDGEVLFDLALLSHRGWTMQHVKHAKWHLRVNEALMAWPDSDALPVGGPIACQ